jgi:hypothetical protein
MIKKYYLLFGSCLIFSICIFLSLSVIYATCGVYVYIKNNEFPFEIEYIYFIFKSSLMGIPIGVCIWFLECQRLKKIL